MSGITSVAEAGPSTINQSPPFVHSALSTRHQSRSNLGCLKQQRREQMPLSLLYSFVQVSTVSQANKVYMPKKDWFDCLGHPPIMVQLSSFPRNCVQTSVPSARSSRDLCNEKLQAFPAFSVWEECSTETCLRWTNRHTMYISIYTVHICT